MTRFSINTLKTIVICVIASFVIAGFLNPIGQISGPVAEAFDIPVTIAIARFGYGAAYLADRVQKTCNHK